MHLWTLQINQNFSPLINLCSSSRTVYVRHLAECGPFGTACLYLKLSVREHVRLLGKESCTMAIARRTSYLLSGLTKEPRMRTTHLDRQTQRTRAEHEQSNGMYDPELTIPMDHEVEESLTDDGEHALATDQNDENDYDDLDPNAFPLGTLR